MIYFDAAATALHRPAEVKQAVCNALDTMGSVGRGGHEVSLQATRTVFACRQRLADLFHGWGAAHVCFTANATEALNLTIAGLLTPQDHVITTDWEHNSVLRPLYRLQEQGLQITFVPANAQGALEYAAFEKAVRPHTKAVICTHASNVTGDSLDLAWVGKFCRAHGLLLIVDAAQTAGVLPIDMQAWGISVLCFTGHKGLFGPQGTGGLCVAPNVAIRPWKVGGSGIDSFSRQHPTQYPEALEAGTLNTHGIAGLLAGVTFVQKTGITQIHKREIKLARIFYEGIQRLPAVRVFGDWERTRTSIVSFAVVGEDAGQIADMLSEQYQICVRAGAHCAPRIHQALGTESLVRFSFSYWNTEEEVAQAIWAMEDLLC